MAFERHRDERLQEAFRRLPFQGADPEAAEFLFVGLDANFARDIHTMRPLYRDMLDYLGDGVAFWEKHGVHHPFLLHGTAKDGRLYHQRFAEIGFTKVDAQRVSFVELLDVATTGRSRLVQADLDPAHLANLRKWITGPAVRCVFMARRVAQLLRQARLFDELRELPSAQDGGLPGWTLASGQRLLMHYHFSVWGHQYERLQQDLARIRAIVRPSQ